MKNNKIIVKTLLDESKQKVNLTLKDNNGLTVLHYAAQSNLFDILKILIDYDKSSSFLEETDNNGIICLFNETSLHLAVKNGNLECVKILIESDPKLNIIKNKKGISKFVF